MKRLSPRELILLCSPLLLLGVAGILLSPREPLDRKRVSLRLTFKKPTLGRSLDGTGAIATLNLQGPQATRWKLLTLSPHLELETPTGWTDSFSPEAKKWRSALGWGQTPTSVTLNFSRVPQGRVMFVCEARLASREKPQDAPQRITQKWLLNRESWAPLWNGTRREPGIALSNFKITRIGKRDFAGVSHRVVCGAVDFDTSSPSTSRGNFDAILNAARPFLVNFWVPNIAGNFRANNLSSHHQFLNIELSDPYISKVPKMPPARLSGRAGRSGQRPLAFQIEPFDYTKVKVGQQLKFKSWPVSRPNP